MDGRATDTGRQRVTLAVLATKLDYVISGLAEIKGCMRVYEQRIEQLEQVVNVIKWVGGAATMVLIVIAAAWAKKTLGL